MTASTVGTVGLGSTLAGGLLSAFGATSSAKSSSDMYNYQAAVARINSQIDRSNADYAIGVGESQAKIAGQKGAQTLGFIRSTQGGNGLDVNIGSNRQVFNSQSGVLAQDQNTIRQNAAKTAYDYNVKAGFDEAQAGAYDAAAKNAKTAGWINAAGSLISTAGSVSSKWLQGNTSGLWGSNASRTYLPSGSDGEHLGA